MEERDALAARFVQAGLGVQSVTGCAGKGFALVPEVVIPADLPGEQLVRANSSHGCLNHVN